MMLVERLRDALAAAHDAVLLTGDDREAESAAGVPAAVLIAVTDRPDPGLILTQRTGDLRKHAGQIAFPGGRIDPGDADAVTAALREAREEIALDPQAVQVVGTADSYRTITGYSVTPVIGVIPSHTPLIAQPDEVASVFEVPLAFLLDQANHVEASVEFQGHVRHYYEIQWADRRIWGATAAIIVNLSRRLRWTA